MQNDNFLCTVNMLKTKIFMKFYGLMVQYGLNLDHTKSWNDILFPVSFMPNQLKITFFVLTEHTKTALILKWLTRFKICVGIARGLTYLHEEVTPRIIHRDIKLQNILLDKKWNPKIADFGTVRLFPDDMTNLSMSKSMVTGTR